MSVKSPTHSGDPIIAPLSSLFNNLNLDKLRLDNIDIHQFVYNLTPSLLSQFLNEQGYNLQPSIFDSIPTQTLQHILNDSKLCIYLKRKLEKPTHKYSISKYVQDEYFKTKPSSSSSAVLSPASFSSSSSYSNHSTTPISSSLSSQCTVPKNPQILRNILRGILMAESNANHDKNSYVNPTNGAIQINDTQLKISSKEW